MMAAGKIPDLESGKLFLGKSNLIKLGSLKGLKP
jgi:hypothetical protein